MGDLVTFLSKCEVEKRLAELRTLNESATKGRMRSQRGGPGDIFVKKDCAM